ncbi:hypothetical protein MTBSS4_210108 [Magnetospirillum sp. SS-4]|nr:hypothetical protein MTBSS4_210108 [Magnetospirillum sp. SS-4]
MYSSAKLPLRRDEVALDPAGAAPAPARWLPFSPALTVEHGCWKYLLVEDPGKLGIQMNVFTDSKWDEGPFELK